MKSCPSRQLTGIQVLREQADYPVVSGEIVRVLAYCIEPSPEATIPEATTPETSISKDINSVNNQEIEEKQIHEINE